jgi:hypothetical protein
MKRVSRAHRTSIETLRAIVEYLGAHPHSLDTEAVDVIGGVSRQQVNAIRHLVVDMPEAIPRLLSGELSVAEATAIRCAGSSGRKTKAALNPSEVERFRDELRAWIALTRELLNSMEKIFSLQNAEK